MLSYSGYRIDLPNLGAFFTITKNVVIKILSRFDAEPHNYLSTEIDQLGDFQRLRYGASIGQSQILFQKSEFFHIKNLESGGIGEHAFR